MSCLGTRAVPNLSRMSGPINSGMCEPLCTSNSAIGIHPVPPILDLLLAKWHWTGFWHITAVFRSKHHLSCPVYKLISLFVYLNTECYKYIQGVPGGMDKISGECSLG